MPRSPPPTRPRPPPHRHPGPGSAQRGRTPPACPPWGSPLLLSEISDASPGELRRYGGTNHQAQLVILVAVTDRRVVKGAVFFDPGHRGITLLHESIDRRGHAGVILVL